MSKTIATYPKRAGGEKRWQVRRWAVEDEDSRTEYASMYFRLKWAAFIVAWWELALNGYVNQVAIVDQDATEETE